MNYIHVKNLEKYHQGYKDRSLQWAKIYFRMIHGDPDWEMIDNEVDKWRFVAFVCLELQARKGIPLDDRYLKNKGFDLEKRPISLTIQMLHNFLRCVTEDEERALRRVEYSRVDKSRVEKNRVDSVTHPTEGNNTIHKHENWKKQPDLYKGGAK